MLSTSVMFDLGYRANIHANMDRKIYNKVGQVNVTVAPKLGGVFAEQGHEANCPFEEAPRKNLIVQSQRLERRASFGVERSVVRFFEGEGCRLMHMNMIRMFISTDGVM